MGRREYKQEGGGNEYLHGGRSVTAGFEVGGEVGGRCWEG